MKFALKEVAVARHDIPHKLDELRLEWVSSILLSLKVPLFMMDKVCQDPEMSSQEWRAYLYDTHGIQVIYDIAKESISIIKINHDNGAMGTVAEWFKPEVSYQKGHVARCTLHLNYWPA